MRTTKGWIVIALMASAMVCLLSAQTDRSASSLPSSDRWPRAVVIVFERRIPPQSARQGRIGAQIRELRKAVVRLLEHETDIRSGDHIFAFTDGMSQSDFDCLVNGLLCEYTSADVRPLMWTDNLETARSFLTRMLRLPKGPKGGPPGEVVKWGGAEFLHLEHDGRVGTIDCLLRREITAPMTMGASFGEGRNCPTEGEESNQLETRAISRVEISMPVQFAAALSVLKDRPISGLTWIWALLEDKNYDRQDTLHGIRSDFGSSRGAPIARLFDAAYKEYRVTGRNVALQTRGPFVRSYEIRWERTEALRERLGRSPELLEITVGRSHTPLTPTTLEISRGFLAEPWEPAVDSLEFTAELHPSLGGRLVAGHLSADVGGRRLSTSASAMGQQSRIVLGIAEVQEMYQRTLRSWIPRSLRLQTNFEFLVMGGEADREVQFVPIPAPLYSARKLDVVSRLPSTRLAGVLGAMLIVLAVITYRVIQPMPIHIRLQPNPVEWDIPNKRYNRQLHIVGYTEYFHRRWLPAVTTVSVDWELLVPIGFPSVGSNRVLRLQRGKKSLEPNPGLGDSKSRRTVRWQPGSQLQPTTIEVLDLMLDEGCFSSLAASEPVEYGCEIRMRVSVSPRATLKLRAFDEILRLPVRIRVHEIAPAPQVSFEIDSNYRRLGLDATSCVEFGSVIVANRPPKGAAGIPRRLNVSARIGLSEKDRDVARVYFEGGEETWSGSIPGNDDGRRRVWLELKPNQLVEPRRLSGTVMVGAGASSQDETTWARGLKWSLTCVPRETALVGLDLGTSGTRLFVQKGRRSFEDERVPFPMGIVNQGDATVADEFPSMVLIDESGRVVRAGGGPRGIHAQEGNARFVESPKAQLLAAKDPESVENAKKDLASYVNALARIWTNIRAQLQLGDVKIVVAVPWSYTQQAAAWYVELIRSKFDGAVVVAPVREAEAAAYFHILRQYVTYEGQQTRFPHDRRHRTLVVDFGAGTVDYAIVGTSTQVGAVTGLQTLAHNFSTSAGNRYDEVLLEQLFTQDDSVSMLKRSRRLRDDVRRFKERALDAMLNSSQPIRHDQWGLAATADRGQFLARMEPFFQSAISNPLERLAQSLSESDNEGKRPYVDEVLFAGRGLFAVGCRERIVADVQRFFVSAPRRSGIAVQSFGGAEAQDVSAAVVRGALVFGRSGDVMIGSSDLAATRDAALLVEAGGIAHVRWLKRIGERIEEDEALAFSFKEAVRRAWSVGGEPVLTSDRLQQAFSQLSRGVTPDSELKVLATWLPQAGTKNLHVLVGGDETVRFSYPGH